MTYLPVLEETEAGEQVIELGGDVSAAGARPDELQPPPVNLDIRLPDLGGNKAHQDDKKKIPRILLEILTLRCPVTLT